MLCKSLRDRKNTKNQGAAIICSILRENEAIEDN